VKNQRIPVNWLSLYLWPHYYVWWYLCSGTSCSFAPNIISPKYIKTRHSVIVNSVFDQLPSSLSNKKSSTHLLSIRKEHHFSSLSALRKSDIKFLTDDIMKMTSSGWCCKPKITALVLVLWFWSLLSLSLCCHVSHKETPARFSARSPGHPVKLTCMQMSHIFFLNRLSRWQSQNSPRK